MSRTLKPKNDRAPLALPVLSQSISLRELHPEALSRWNSALVAREAPAAAAAAAAEDDSSINIYDMIGYDPWTGTGTTAKRISAALRSIGKRDVTVNINSPGGDLFEGIAIYNLLRDHPANVTTRVIGLAASAASVIAMAGDTIQAAHASFMMIHNVWVMAMGNRNDLRDAADQLESFDDALASVYAARTGQDKKTIAKLMDKETWFSGDQAIADGFADELLPADAVTEKSDQVDAPANGLRAIETVLARYGIPRNERRALINRIKESGSASQPDARTDPEARRTLPLEDAATQDAGREIAEFIERNRQRAAVLSQP